MLLAVPVVAAIYKLVQADVRKRNTATIAVKEDTQDKNK